MTGAERFRVAVAASKAAGLPDRADFAGGKFAALVGKLRKRGATNPKALAAYIGRKKLGKGAFQRLAAAGRRKKAKAV